MSSISQYVNELRNINAEIKRLSKEASVLRKRAKIVEENIINYLNEKEQPGVKFKDTAIVVETKPKWSYKGKKDKDEDSIRILEENGVSNPKDVLSEIFRARKGNELESKKLKITKLKTKE
jgi:DNA polymerase sigma